jgi:FkbM family methyltransferase
MTGSGEDSFWLEAKDFVNQYLQPGDRLLAPAKFKSAFSLVSVYGASYSQNAAQFEWVLFHKGMMGKIERGFLRQTLDQLHPVFANEVFVIFAKRADLPGQLLNTNHLQAFLNEVDPRTRLATAAAKSSGSSGRLRTVRRRIRNWLGTDSEVQSSQLEAILDCTERIDYNTRQTQVVLNRVEALEKVVDQVLPGANRPTSAWMSSKTLLAQMSRQEFYDLCRAACQTAYLGNGEILCRILATYLLYGDTTDVGILPHLCLNGYWEPWLTLAMLQAVRPGWACLDIGANHGYYALVLAGAVGPQGRVLALEPNFKLAEMVRKSLEVNGFNDRAQIKALAASAQAGDTVKLVVPNGNTGHASIHRDPTATDQVMEVETVTIDALTADWERVDLIKIDTEGAEEGIWQGMKETIRRNPNINIVLEFGSARYADAKTFLEEIQAEGFRLRYVDYDARVKEISVERCLTERLESYWDLFLSRR